MQKTKRVNMEVIFMELKNKNRERILKFCAAMNMTVGNALFRKIANHQAT